MLKGIPTLSYVVLWWIPLVLSVWQVCLGPMICCAKRLDWASRSRRCRTASLFVLAQDGACCPCTHCSFLCAGDPLRLWCGSPSWIRTYLAFFLGQCWSTWVASLIWRIALSAHRSCQATRCLSFRCPRVTSRSTCSERMVPAQFWCRKLCRIVRWDKKWLCAIRSCGRSLVTVCLLRPRPPAPMKTVLRLTGILLTLSHPPMKKTLFSS